MHKLKGLLTTARLVQSSCASAPRNTREAGISTRRIFFSNSIFFLFQLVVALAIKIVVAKPEANRYAYPYIYPSYGYSYPYRYAYLHKSTVGQYGYKLIGDL